MAMLEHPTGAQSVLAGRLHFPVDGLDFGGAAGPES